ncbi:hypothetical protein L1887_21255 [Cichorium endivia]|nr:hypothetical protein L1887_21255 [Cichorium endivia]
MASSSKCGDEMLTKLPNEANDQQLIGDDQVDLHTQLWLECAGLTVKIPRVGDKVFYFPQGHLDQVEAYMKQEGMINIPSYGLPSKILCKAEVDTDEVFVEITLLPNCEEAEVSTSKSVPQKIPTCSFRKKLTPFNDTSQNFASQELVARDLQGQIWNFHHICRGIPKRHLLTSGWGKFVSAKRLIVGDTCIFLRKNELYIGIQRAARLVKLSTDLCSINMQHGILATALEAMNTRTEFAVYYHPRISPSGFIVRYDEFMESLKVNCSPKTRVKMIVDEGGEEPEHNLKKVPGIIIRKEDVDPTSWPSSEWRCLKVSWDDTSSGHVPRERVSPCDIQSFEIVKHQQSLVSFSQKRSMIDYNKQGQGIREATELTHLSVKIPSSTCLVESKICKLFGVDIWDTDSSKQQSQITKPCYIKVLKHRTFVGRSIDLSRFSGYLFGFHIVAAVIREPQTRIASHPPPAAAISSLLLRRLLHPCSPAAAHPLQLLGIRSVSFSNSSIIVLHLRRLFCESGFVCAPPFFSDEFLHL